MDCYWTLDSGYYAQISQQPQKHIHYQFLWVMRWLVLLAGKMGEQIQKQIQCQLIKRYQKTQLHLSCKEVMPPLVQLLLATFKQWVTKSVTLDNDVGTYIILPIAFPTKGITAVLSDTWGRLSNSSAMENQTEGASINAVNPNSVQIINYWSGG